MSKTKIKELFLLRKLAAVTALIAMICFGTSGFLSAQAVNEGYNSDETLQKGMLVSIREDDPKKVEKASGDNLDRLKGAVVQRNDSPVTLAGSGQDVFVATSGTYEVLVSDENGQIKQNDYISISSLAGIGMKANDEQKTVLGRATGNFSGREDSIGSYEDPKTKAKINFGRINVAISVSPNPWRQEAVTSQVPNFLKSFSGSVAGKPVDSVRIWLSLALFLGTIIIVGVMIYSSARGSLISIGRNPLSKAVIVRGMTQIVILSVIIFISGMFGVYLLLKL